MNTKWIFEQRKKNKSMVLNLAGTTFNYDLHIYLFIKWQFLSVFMDTLGNRIFSQFMQWHNRWIMIFNWKSRIRQVLELPFTGISLWSHCVVKNCLGNRILKNELKQWKNSNPLTDFASNTSECDNKFSHFSPKKSKVLLKGDKINYTNT